MWTWSLNWGEVTPEIVVGTCPMAAGDLARIRAGARASAVLSLQHDSCLAYWGIDYAEMCAAAEELGMTMSRCPIRDFDVADMRRCLPDAVAALAALLTRGHRTYVHCTAGLGRAPLTVLAYLILVERRDPEQAIRLILRARPGAVPAWEAYHGCRGDLIRRYGRRIEQRAYELHQRGVYGDALADWCEAEAEVLAEALMGETVTGAIGAGHLLLGRNSTETVQLGFSRDEHDP